MPTRIAIPVASVLWLGLVIWSPAPQARQRADRGSHDRAAAFQTSDTCLACHNGLRTPTGDDVSIGSDWRGSMMANSSRDPYWQASVRRETIDHPTAAAAVEDSCAVCHMPMARAHATARAQRGQVFSHLPIGARRAPANRLAHDGVSCTMCHQIADEKLGTPDSFNGGFVVNAPDAAQGAVSLGPFAVEGGPASVMQSASTYRPVEATHLRKSELCATCHTLYTEALGPRGEPVGRLPEQVPFLEWRHSAFRDDKSCQACHMPVVREATPIASVLGAPRDGLARHVFRGGNFFVLAMLNRFRRDIGVSATPEELDAAGDRTVELLQTETATVSIDQAARSEGRLTLDVVVRNLTGHKLPTGYPSRRAWLHVAIRDRTGRMVFESGAPAADGRIQGNDNDADPGQFEPHVGEIQRGEEVAIYESIMGDAGGNVTTGLLKATRYLKDNRLLPQGFDKATAESDIAVVGGARDDSDFGGGSDRVRYLVDVPPDEAPFQVDVALRFQPISFRWAQNLEPYQSPETRRFVGYYKAMASESGIVLARASVAIR